MAGSDPRAILDAAQEAVGQTARRFATSVLDVDERTLRRWRDGSSEVPGPARQLCRLIVVHPELADEIMVPPGR